MRNTVVSTVVPKACFNASSLMSQLVGGGHTFKGYSEDLPSIGFRGKNHGLYARKHVPWISFCTMPDGKTAADSSNLRFQQDFPSDYDSLPTVSFVIPNMQNDGHDGSLNQADSWLQTNVAPVLANSSFQKDGLLIILFDESFSGDTQYGGGQVAMVVISPLAKKGYQSTTLYQHQSMCRLMLEGLGLTTFPGACQGAAQMNEFF